MRGYQTETKNISYIVILLNLLSVCPVVYTDLRTLITYIYIKSGNNRDLSITLLEIIV